MASSYLAGLNDQTFDSTVYSYISTPPPLDTSTSPPEISAPPSPNGYSAAAILAALAGSRPPTGPAEDEDRYEEDNEPGGISLVEDGQEQEHILPQPVSQPDAMSTPPIPTAFTHLAALHSGQAYFDIQPASTYDDVLVSALDQLTQIAANPSPAALTAISAQLSTSPHVPMPPTSVVPVAQYYEGLMSRDDGAFIDPATFFELSRPSTDRLQAPLEFQEQPEVITWGDLRGDHCDFQGIDWASRGTTRAAFEEKRNTYERERIMKRPVRRRRWHDELSKKDNYFSFRRMNTRHRAFYPHFQLRNLLATTSRNDVYYATKAGVYRTDTYGTAAKPVIDIRKRTYNGTDCAITTLAAANDVLVAGGLEGEYAIADLTSTHGTPYTTGAIRDPAPESKSYITNHIHLFSGRTTYTPQAVLCSNDSRLRVLDCATNTFRHSFTYPSAVNCSATSPDGRMRVVVGDFHQTLITNAETGQSFETLNAHVDDVFACAWADDGIHIATAAQDSTIVVWDARSWKRPVSVVPSELGIPRVLRFSPVGGGPRVLVAAEADDYISIINAQTFDSKQLFTFFGPHAGISMTPDGQSLFVANAERRFGGIIELERTGSGEIGHGCYPSQWDTEEAMVDWMHDEVLDDNFNVASGYQERNRRGLDLGALSL